jgi:hypothetical protein
MPRRREEPVFPDITVMAAERNGTHQTRIAVPKFKETKCTHCDQPFLLTSHYMPQPCRECGTLNLPCDICVHKDCGRCPMDRVLEAMTAQSPKRGF